MNASQRIEPDVVDALPSELHLSGELLHIPAEGDVRPEYFLFRPPLPNPDLPPLMSVHGISRNAEEHVQAFLQLATRQKRVLIVPHFDAVHYGGFQRVGRKAVSATDRMLCDVESRLGYPLGSFDIVGFSGGAQFAHRYAWLYPEKVSSQTLVSAGWYTFPDTHTLFPYGISGKNWRGRQASANLERFLSIPTQVLVGTDDVARDGSLRTGVDIDIRQGMNRVERAARWSCEILSISARFGIGAAIQFRALPGCGHSFRDCVDNGNLVNLVAKWPIVRG